MNRSQRRSEWRDRFRGSQPPRPSINLRIDELRLEGIPSAGSRRIADGFREELRALLEVHGVPEAWVGRGTMERAGTPAMSIDQVMRPQSLGEQAARAVWDLKPVERR